MFRLQPTDTITSSGVGMGWREWLGRADAVYFRGVYAQATPRQQEGLCCPGVLPLASRTGRQRSTQR